MGGVLFLIGSGIYHHSLLIAGEMGFGDTLSYAAEVILMIASITVTIWVCEKCGYENAPNEGRVLRQLRQPPSGLVAQGCIDRPKGQKQERAG